MTVYAWFRESGDAGKLLVLSEQKAVLKTYSYDQVLLVQAGYQKGRCALCCPFIWPGDYTMVKKIILLSEHKIDVILTMGSRTKLGLMIVKLSSILLNQAGCLGLFLSLKQ